MPASESNFLNLIARLNAAEVEHVVIGGVAMVLHGSSYVTTDVDIFYRRSVDQARAVVNALEAVHPRPREFPKDVPFIWDEQTVMNSTILTLETDFGDIDILSEAAGAPAFADLYAQAKMVDIDGVELRFAHIDHLILMKEAAGRPKDLERLSELKSIKDEGEVASD